MRHSWRLLILRSNSVTHLQRPTSFPFVKVQSFSVSSPFHTQSRTHLTRTIKSRNSLYTYISLDSKSSIRRKFSSAGDAIDGKRDEIEEDLKLMAIGEKRNAMYFDWMYKKWLEGVQSIEKMWELRYIRAVKTLIKFSDADDIKRELNDLVIDADLLTNVLEGFEWNPNVAKRFFDFILDYYSGELDYDLYYTLYNSMLCVFGVNGLLDEFWDLAETMNVKRYLVSSSSCKENRYLIDNTAYQKVSESFRKQGLVRELEKLILLFVIQSMDNRMINIALLFDTLDHYRPLDWNKFQDIISVKFWGDFVKLVLEQEGVHLKHALMFFRWIENRDWHEDNEQTYRFIASVLGKEDCCLDKLKAVDELRSRANNESDVIEMYPLRFYENALARSNTTPSVNCCIYLLMELTFFYRYERNILSSQIMDVVDAFETNEGILTDSIVEELINTLVSVNKTKNLNMLGELVMSSSRRYRVEHRPTPPSRAKYGELDRQRRARLIFSELQQGEF